MAIKLMTTLGHMQGLGKEAMDSIEELIDYLTRLHAQSEANRLGWQRLQEMSATARQTESDLRDDLRDRNDSISALETNCASLARRLAEREMQAEAAMKSNATVLELRKDYAALRVLTTNLEADNASLARQLSEARCAQRTDDAYLQLRSAYQEMSERNLALERELQLLTDDHNAREDQVLGAPTQFKPGDKVYVPSKMKGTVRSGIVQQSIVRTGPKSSWTTYMVGGEGEVVGELVFGDAAAAFVSMEVKNDQ